MCQLCDEADAYLAEIEARAKAREEEQKQQRKPAAPPDKDLPRKIAMAGR